jgi:hypothetical protein
VKDGLNTPEQMTLLTAAKVKDLQSLLQLIPPVHHKFYSKFSERLVLMMKTKMWKTERHE